MSISYNIEPHNIAELTWPMWEACGIECPAMIGAPCPGKDTSRYMDGPADATHFRRGCPGWSAKFPNAAAEVVHGWSLESFQDDEAGTTEFGGSWFALFGSDKDADPKGPMGAGLILCVYSWGAVEVTRYGTTEELTRNWAKIEAGCTEEEEN